VLSGKWEFVKGEIEKVNQAVVERGAILKVIFENDCEFQIPTYKEGINGLMRI
jgi:deoxyribose-phosphate aldolase